MPLLCKSCSGKLVFDPDLGKMRCLFCGCDYEVQDEASDLTTPGMMDLDVSVCRTCGAVLSFHGVEMNAVCSFCGNTDLSRQCVSNKRPDSIIPFHFGKDKAEKLLRDHLAGSVYISKAARQMKISDIRGIYIPYYIVAADYRRVMTLYKERQDENGHALDPDIITRSVSCNFDKLTIEASEMLLDDASIRLEPYDVSGLRDFSEGYLQGFSADMADREANNLYRKGREACHKMADQEIRSRGVIPVKYIISEDKERVTFGGAYHYALFPVWFITGSYDGKKVTFLINGQSGKIVGTPKINKAGFKAAVAGKCLVTVPLMAAAGTVLSALFLAALHTNLYILFMLLCVTVVLIKIFFRKYEERLADIRKLIDVAGSEKLISFMQRRSSHDGS